MSILPHTPELLVIIIVIAVIFGLGRLPQLSYKLAGADAHAKKNGGGSDRADDARVEADEESPADET